MNEKKISKSAGGVGIAILGSRILGFARDVLMANYFGTGMAAQAFFAAFRIPNLMRRLFGEGALSASFIPVFTEEMQKGGRENAWSLALAVLNILSLVLAVIVVLGMMFASGITRLIVPGFAEVPGQFELTSNLLRIMFPYLFFICLAALMMGILNSLRHFSTSAVAPMLLNVSLICYMVFFAGRAENPAMGLGIAVLVGGAAQLLIQLAVACKKGLPLGGRVVLYHPKMKRIAGLMIPAAGGLAVYQVNILVDSVCASYESIVGRGAIAALWYADRMMQFPLSIFGIATATVVFPLLSSAVLAGDFRKFSGTVEFGLKRVFFLTLPSAAGLIVLRRHIISALFERNEFDAYSTAITSSALMYYCLGLFAFAGVHILSRGFYALQDTKTPVKFAAGAMVLNAVLNIIFMRILQVGGIALATSLAAACNFILLFRALFIRGAIFAPWGVVLSFLKVLAVSVIMGVVLVFARNRMPEADSDFLRLGIIALLMGVGLAVFISLAAAFGFEELKSFGASFKRE